MKTTDLLVLGGAAVGLYLFKDQIMEFVNELKGGMSGGAPEPAPLPVEPDGGTGAGGTGTEVDPELSSRTLTIDYYAGRVAQSVTKVSNRNIYNWQEIKNVIIEKYIADVTAIAETNKWEKKPIDENNMASMRAYARLVLKVAQQMNITLNPTEKKALEEVAGVGVTPMVPKSTQEHRQYIHYTYQIINVAPPVVVTQINPVVYYKTREYFIKRGWRPRPGVPRTLTFKDWAELDKWYLIRYGHQRPTGTTLPPGCTINSTTGVITCVQSSLAFTVPDSQIRFTMA